MAQANAVILFGEADADEAALSQLSMQVLGQLGMLLAIAHFDDFAGLDLIDTGLQNVGSKVLCQIRDHLLVFVQFKFHDSSPPVNIFLLVIDRHS